MFDSKRRRARREYSAFPRKHETHGKIPHRRELGIVNACIRPMNFGELKSFGSETDDAAREIIGNVL